jgi:endonuclease/exonuclease/phosphatase family metal-dependent hydrolase
MPVIATGDFNVSKYNPISKPMLPAMEKAGFGDILDQSYGVNPPAHPRPRTMIHAWINSYNHESTDVRDFSVDPSRGKVGNGLDWIFASNNLAVKEYEVVVRFDPRTMKVRGTLPSDHNLVRAVIHLS